MGRGWVTASIWRQRGQRRSFFLRRERWREAAAVDHIICGTVWDPSPREDGTFPNEAHCNRCGKRRVATRLHTLWLCEANEGIDDPLVKDSQCLVKDAIKGWGDDRCLWARGLLPGRLGQPVPRPGWDEIKTWGVGDFANVVNRGGRIYTDGAGPCGKTFRPGSLVHAGAVAVLEGKENGVSYVRDYAALCGGAPGKQSVPRAEVWGLILAASHAPGKPDLQVGVDARYAILGREKEVLMKRGDNGDLWCTLFRIVAAREGSITFHKVPAHTTDKGVAFVVEAEPIAGDAVGNALADNAARLGRQLAGLDFEDQEWQFTFARAVKVMKRLAVVQVNDWEARECARIYEQRPEPGCTIDDGQVVLDKIINKLWQAGHRIVRRGDLFSCEVCKKGRRRLQDWVKLRCKPKLSAEQLVARHRLYSGSLTLTSLCRGTGRGGCERVEAAEEIPTATATGSSMVAAALVADKSADFRSKVNDHVGCNDMDIAADVDTEENLSHDAAMVVEGAGDGGGGVHPFLEPPVWDDNMDTDAPLQEDQTAGGRVAREGHASSETLLPPELGDTAITEGESRGYHITRRVRRRLNSKTSPAVAVASTTGGDQSTDEASLLTRREARAEASRHETKRRKVEMAQRQEEERAWNHLEKHPGLLRYGGEPPEPEVDVDLAEGPTFHATHNIAYSRNAGVAFCRTCAAWSSGRKAKKLRVECPGSCGQASLLRRLELGLRPVGDRIPAALKQPGARGTRGGR